MEIQDRINTMIKQQYGFSVRKIEQRSGGWSALAFYIETDNEKLFLKLYDKRRPSAKPFIEAIDRYIPVVRWLHDHTDLKQHMINPIFTKDNHTYSEDEGFIYLLSEYIEGHVVGAEPMQTQQLKELAKILSTLHKSTKCLPKSLIDAQIKEEFDVAFCTQLEIFMNNDLNSIQDDVCTIVGNSKLILIEAIKRIQYLADLLKSKPEAFVLCHCDAHNWNIMQSEHLILIDWECLKLAPVEHDLILNIQEPYALQFLSEYTKTLSYEHPDLDAFEFYYLKRMLEDIWEWIKGLRADDLIKSKESAMVFLKNTLNECARASLFRERLKALNLC